MGVQQTLDEINSKLGVLVEKEEGVTLTLEEYMAMKKVYDANKDQNYHIHLQVLNETFINEGGKRTQISHIRTNKFSFPDDTHTQLSELFSSVYENSQWVEYLEAKLAETQAEVRKLEYKNEELHSEKKKLQELYAENGEFQTRRSRRRWWQSR